jgi:hypothetical protein
MHATIRRPVAAWRRGYWFLIVATVLSVALADWLFYGHPVGWTAGLFAAFVVALLTLRGGAFLRTGRGVLVVLAAGGLVAALVEEPTPLAVLLTALAASMLAVLNRNPWPGGTRLWALRLVEGIGFALVRVVTDNRVALRWLRRRPMSGAGPARLVTVWALPIALGAVFVALFRAANPIIARLVGDALDWMGDLLSHVLALVDLPRNVFWACVAAAVYALLRVRRSRRRAAGSAAAAAEEWDHRGADEATADAARVTAYSLAPRAVSAEGVIVRCLLVFNALFAVQTALDALYLFGGAALPDGMTFAEYAHRGAYPLVATALLAAAFVLIAFRPGGAAERSTLARRLVYAWVAQNVFLTVTAAWRLDLYVGVYSLTRLRLAAGVWMLLVATGLVWIGCRIVLRRDNAWLLNANVLTTLAVLYACCFVNFDGAIADYNVAHCREAGGEGVAIDADYLYSLGPDALPAMRRLTPMLKDPNRRRAAEAYGAAFTSQLRDELRDWRGWTLRRWSTWNAADPISGASVGG